CCWTTSTNVQKLLDERLRTSVNFSPGRCLKNASWHSRCPKPTNVQGKGSETSKSAENDKKRQEILGWVGPGPDLLWPNTYTSRSTNFASRRRFAQAALIVDCIAIGLCCGRFLLQRQFARHLCYLLFLI